MEKLIEQLLKELGEDPKREGLSKTPLRVKESLSFLTKGYGENPHKLLSEAMYEEKYDEMVFLKDIEMFSMCEHHLLPFYGKCHVAYLPDKKVIGLSKIPRLVEIYSRRLQVQERLTTQIAQTLQDVIKPLGVAVVIEAFHLCMAMRGVEKQNAYCTTSAMFGAFRSNSKTRMEFISLLGAKKNF
ncbi:MAG: GTP cyclohydrolase I FolE [bacterium]|nr:GTP cyclohydrolase I FolE [bacterium]